MPQDNSIAHLEKYLAWYNNVLIPAALGRKAPSEVRELQKYRDDLETRLSEARRKALKNRQGAMGEGSED